MIVVNPGEQLHHEVVADEFFCKIYCDNTTEQPIRFSPRFLELIADQAWRDGDNGYDFEVPVFFNFTQRLNNGEHDERG